jgi:hypothetical protein
LLGAASKSERLARDGTRDGRRAQRAGLTGLLVALLALSGAPAAHAGSQVLSGTTANTSASVGTITAATFGTNLSASGTVHDTGVGTVPIVAIGSWTMTVTGGGTSGNEGHLALASGQSSTCPKSSSVLTNAMNVYPTASLAGFTAATYNSAALSSSNTEPLGASAITLGTGTGNNTITIRYDQPMSSSDQLQPGCLYNETTTITVS